MIKYDIRGNRKTGYFVDTVLNNGDRITGAQRFDSKTQAEMYIECQLENERKAEQSEK